MNEVNDAADNETVVVIFFDFNYYLKFKPITRTEIFQYPSLEDLRNFRYKIVPSDALLFFIGT